MVPKAFFMIYNNANTLLGIGLEEIESKGFLTIMVLALIKQCYLDCFLFMLQPMTDL